MTDAAKYPYTKKIYETDGLVLRFDANVLACELSRDGLFDTVLDQTAFFPGGGGQEFDTGTVGGANVIAVKAVGDVIVHTCDAFIGPGTAVSCRVNEDERMRRMEHHTAEHILSGTIHRLFGLDNVGFHLGSEYVTIDTSGPLTLEQLAEAELAANAAVRRNEKIEILFPSDDELSAMEYRSKKELTGRVRIVKIGNIDTCACCAPHLETTGQTGLITITSYMPYKSGMRLTMLAGNEAVRELRRRQDALKSAGEMLSAKVLEVPAAVEKLKNALADAHYEKTRLLEQMCETKLLPQLTRTDYRLLVDENCDAKLANRIGDKYMHGVLFFLALTGPAGERKYVMKSEKLDLRAAAPTVNSILNGRGGGKPGEISGSTGISEEDIESKAEELYRAMKSLMTE